MLSTCGGTPAPHAPKHTFSWPRPITIIPKPLRNPPEPPGTPRNPSENDRGTPGGHAHATRFRGTRLAAKSPTLAPNQPEFPPCAIKRVAAPHAHNRFLATPQLQGWYCTNDMVVSQYKTIFRTSLSQTGANLTLFPASRKLVADHPANGPTDRLTDRPSVRSIDRQTHRPTLGPPPADGTTDRRRPADRRIVGTTYRPTAGSTDRRSDLPTGRWAHRPTDASADGATGRLTVRPFDR